MPTVTFKQDIFHPLVHSAKSTAHAGLISFLGSALHDEQRHTPGELDLTLAKDEVQTTHGVSIVLLLLFVRRCFQDAEFLDSIPFEHAVNGEAWQAWRSHRTRTRSGGALGGGDDVWTMRVKAVVEASADAVIGVEGVDDEVIQFEGCEEEVEVARRELRRYVGEDNAVA